MARPGSGGLPARRPDQKPSPPPAAQSPGAAAGILRARIIIISGSVDGLYIYSGKAGPGTLVASAVAHDGTDPYGNTVTGPGYAVYGSGGQELDLSVSSGQAQITFKTGSTLEDEPGLIIGAKGGSGAGAFLNWNIKGPIATSQGDSVILEMNSANEGATSSANGEFVYAATSGTDYLSAAWSAAGFVIPAGSIAAVDPSTGTVAAPAVAEPWHSMPSMSASWSVSGFAEYRLLPTGDLQLAFQDLVPGTDTDGTTIWAAGSLPAAYRPAHNSPRLAAYSNALRTGAVGTATEGPALTVLTDGSVECFGIAAASTRVDLSAIVPLTA